MTSIKPTCTTGQQCTTTTAYNHEAADYRFFLGVKTWIVL